MQSKTLENSITAGLARLLIMVVDDNPITRKSVRLALQRENYRVAEASDGAAAFAQMHAETPDLVLLDLLLPDIHGADLIVQLRALPGGSDIPILAFSGFVSKMKVLAWRSSNTLESGFCVDCLEQAVRAYGAPEIFNTDQGCQFTSDAFTGVLKAHGIVISMDGRGQALDNIFVERLWRSVKHEDVYLKGYATLPDLVLGLTEYFVFYNSERMHQSLGYRTPDEVYRTARGGGTRIVTNTMRQKNSLLLD